MLWVILHLNIFEALEFVLESQKLKNSFNIKKSNKATYSEIKYFLKSRDYWIDIYVIKYLHCFTTDLCIE